MTPKLSRPSFDDQGVQACLSIFRDKVTNGGVANLPVPEPHKPQALARQDDMLASHRQKIETLYQSSGAAQWSVSLDNFARAVWQAIRSRVANDPKHIPRLLKSVHAQDLALALGCTQGNEQAWENFSWQCRTTIYEAACSLTADLTGARALSDSLRAELYVGGSQASGGRSRLADFDGRSSLKTWVRAVVYRKYLDERRRNSPLNGFVEKPIGPSPTSSSVPEQNERHDAQLSSQTGRVVPAEFAAHERMLLSYYYVHQLSLKQIGRLTGEHESSASRRLEALRKKLQKHAGKHDPAEYEVFGQRVAEDLRAQFQTNGDRECPGSETLAAYFERSLAPIELEKCETHLAICSPCQGLMAELVRLSDVAEAPTVSTEGAKSPAQDRNAGWFRLALAVPVLLVLAWAGLSYPGEFRHLLQPLTEMAVSPPAPVPIRDSSSEPKHALSSSVTATQRETKKGQGPKEQGADRPSATRDPENAQSPIGPGNDPAAPVAKNSRLIAQTGPDGAPVLRAAGVADEGAAGTKTGGQDDVLNSASAPSLTVLGSVPTVMRRLRVGRHGLIQKIDSSGTWTTVASPVQSDLYDVSFASPSVGWAVGQAGTVLRTTDSGSTWSKISISTEEDLVRIGAISELVARVMTRTGQYLATDDGGKSWVISQQQ